MRGLKKLSFSLPVLYLYAVIPDIITSLEQAGVLFAELKNKGQGQTREITLCVESDIVMKGTV